MNYNRGAIFTPLAVTLAGGVSAAERPNIIYMMTDDQAFNSIRALGNEQVETPNIDRLVDEGVAFVNHYATTSISMASRACVMTGMYEYKTGCNFMEGGLTAKAYSKSYPAILKENGYFQGFAGKFGFAVSAKNGRGDSGDLPEEIFDVWAAGTGSQTSYVTAENKLMAKYADKYPHSTRSYGAFGCDFIEQAAKGDKPFCLTISFKAPHEPRTPDPMFDELYADTEFKLPVTHDYLGHPLQARLGRQFLFYYYKDFTKNYQDNLRKYHRLIHGVDYAVGMICDKLRESGMDKNTIIIFTSDNGYFLGSHHCGGKVQPYVESSKIPLIIVDPRQSATAGSRVKGVTGNIDIAPTILDYAGIAAPSNMDGVSLQPTVRKPTNKPHESLALINAWGSPGIFTLSIVTNDMKYIHWSFNDGMPEAEELFDYRNGADNFEQNNVSGDKRYKKDLEKMRQLHDERLDIWAKNCVSTGNYKAFATILSRNLPWSERKALIPGEYWKHYYNYLKKSGYTGDPHDYRAVEAYGINR